MKSFHIGFSKNRQGKVFSRLLQWYMKKDYSHTFFKFDDKILHAEINDGVNYWSIEKFEEHNVTTKLYKVTVTDEYFEEIMEELDLHSGHSYAFLQNIGIIAVDILKNIGISIRNPFRYGDNCSELVFHGLLETHPDLSSNYSINSIRPDHIEDILIDKGYINSIT